MASNRELQESLLKQISRLSAQIEGDSHVEGEPFFPSYASYLAALEASHNLEYYEKPSKELRDLAKLYEDKMAKFRELTRGKNMSDVEMNAILYRQTLQQKRNSR